MKSRCIFVFVILNLVLNACSKQESKDRADSYPDFGVSSEDQSKLTDVGCHLSNDRRNIECADKSSGQSISEMTDLKNAKAYLEKQKAALEEVRDSIEKTLKERSYSESSKTSASILLTNMYARISLLTTKVIDANLEITRESNYNIILGYRCSGSSATASPEPTKFDQRMVFADMDQTWKLSQTENARSLMQITAKDKQLAVLLIDKSRDLKLAVQTSGELIISTKFGEKVDMSCLKSRVFANATPFTDRPARNYLYCRTFSEMPGVGLKRISHGFPTSDSPIPNDLANPVYDDELQDRPERRHEIQKFGISSTADKNVLKFSISELKTKEVLAEVETMNSTKDIRFDIQDSKGNSVIVECTNKEGAGR